jgi:hypothetical protein
MSGKDLLPMSSTQAPDAFYTRPNFDSPADSPFVYLGWQTKTNFAMRRRQLDTFGSPAAYGQTAIFRIDKSAFKRGPIQLRVTRSALTVQGGGTAAATSFVDQEAAASVALVEFYYGQNRIQQFTGEQLYHKAIMNLRQEQLDAFNALGFGGLSQVSRNAATGLASSSQTWTIDLSSMLYFCEKPSKYLIGTGVSQEPEIRITFSTLGQVTQTDGTSTPLGSITRAWLVPLDIFVEDDEKRYQHAQLESADGIFYKIMDTEYQLNNLLAAGSTSYQIQLNNFKGACVFLAATLRNDGALTVGGVPQGFRQPVAPNTINAMFNYQPFQTWQGQAADVIFLDQTDDIFARYYLFPLLFPGVPGQYLYIHSFSLNPLNTDIDMGHKTWAAFTNPILQITFATALSVNFRCDLWSYNDNNVQHQRNEIYKTFQ